MRGSDIAFFDLLCRAYYTLI